MDATHSLFDAARATHPSVALSQAAEDAFVAAWHDARTREVELCPSPHTADTSAGHRFLESPPPTQPVVLPDDTVSTHVIVYVDVDESGTMGASEVGLENVMVSNGSGSDPGLGDGVLLTDVNGTADFSTWTALSRFIFVTVPSGYRATTPFFAQLDAATDTLRFGLTEDPSTADPNFRWVQISDMQVNDLDDGFENSDDLTEIEGLAEPVEFIIVTGDLVWTGNNVDQMTNYLAGVAGHSSVIHHGFGDHDVNTGCPAVANFENIIDRPTAYSFDHGDVHFIMFNDIRSNDVGGCFVQFEWLLMDLVTAASRVAPNPLRVVIAKHWMPRRAEFEFYATLPPEIDLIGVFSGHWHGSRVRDVDGILDVNTPPSRYGGIDKHSRGFRIVDMAADGTIQTEFREGGIDRHLQIVSPAEGDTIVANLTDVWVNAFHTPALSSSVEFWLESPSGSTVPEPMTPTSSWGWTAQMDRAGLIDGLYSFHVRVIPDVGTAYEDSVSFNLLFGGMSSQPDPYTDWPMYKYNAAGTGWAELSVFPPFHSAWSRNLGTRQNTGSPVVASGRLYAGTTSVSTSSEARLLCLDGASGDLLWEFPAENDVKTTPAVADGRVYFTNSTGTLFALDASTGDELWQAQMGDSLGRWEMSSPTVHDGIVYAGGVSAMSAFDAITGTRLWENSGSTSIESDFVPSQYSAPAVNDDVAIYTSSRGIHAYDRLTGGLVWDEIVSGHYRSVALVDSVAWTAGFQFASQFLRGFHALTGTVIYDSSSNPSANLRESSSAPIVGPGPDGVGVRVIAASGGSSNSVQIDGNLQSYLPPLKVNDWLVPIEEELTCSLPYARSVSSINGTPAWCGQIVYFGADDGILRAVDAESGNVVWSHDIGSPIRSSPALAGNMLYVITSNGTLHAFVSAVIESASNESDPAPGVVTRLLGAAPNPFNPSTRISFDLSTAASQQDVTLKVYDAGGRAVRTLVSGAIDPGRHAIAWDGRDDRGRELASSVYFYELIAADIREHRKLVLLK